MRRLFLKTRGAIMKCDLVLFRLPILVLATTVVILGGAEVKAQTPTVMLNGLSWAPINYTFTTVDYPLGTLGTVAHGINQAGVIVGSYVDHSGTERGFLYYSQGGGYEPLYLPIISDIANDTRAFGINTWDQIVGRYVDHRGTEHGFLDNNGPSFTVDDLLGTKGTQANGINNGTYNAGQIVGTYFDSSGAHGFLYSAGTYTTLNYPSGEGTEALGISNAGQIVGTYFDSSGAHGFLYSGGTSTILNTYTTLNDPLGTNTVANGINEAGQIVGYYANSSGNLQGFIYNSGTYTTLNDPSGEGTEALGINDAGQIVGTYEDSSGRQHGFLATPTTPAPGTAVTVTYSFMTSAPVADGVVGFQPISSSDQALIEQALQTFSAVANITFTLVPNGGNADIMFGEANWSNGGALTYIYWLPKLNNLTGLNSYTAAHTYFDDGNANVNDPVNFWLTLHELGNATGLRDFNGLSLAQDAALGLPASEANFDYSVMANNFPPAYPPQGPFTISPALLDIEALQYLYGANQTGFTAGATTTPAGLVYSFTTNNNPESIWVGNVVAGKTTFDFSACSGPVTINLNAGSFSSTGVVPPPPPFYNFLSPPVPGTPYNNISIAYGTVVQNAIGNNANDIFYGNNAGDTLTGGTGTDIFFIGGGNTKVITQGGINTVVFKETQAK
jgi:probable HAF family extracellular repeat protein